MGLLDKLEQVEIKADSRLPEDDLMFCETQQQAYDESCRALREIRQQWKKAIQAQRDLLGIGQDGSLPYFGSNYRFGITDLNRELEKFHSRFISELTQHFNEKYAYEINAAGRYAPDQLMDIQLAVGLPPAHYGTQYKRFAQYFLDRGMIGFEFNGKVYSICITEAICFPQALAATAPVFKQLQLGTVAKAIVIDIGGFTADYLSLRYGAADWASCDSLENGIITLYNRLLSKIRADYDLLLEETDIDAILTGRSTEYGSEIQSLVEHGAESFVADLFRTLRERKIELRTGKVIFVGGGSLLLRKQIENSGKIGTAIFVEEISANAAGYGLLYAATKANR